MKQILQNLSNGETRLDEVPCPKNIKSNILIASSKSLISSGTERMLVDFGRANFIEKARQQPDKVKKVLSKISTDGLIPTFHAIKSKLDQPLPLGYCNSGVVIESDVPSFSIGDRVVSNGHHAEVVRVPKNLCAKIPKNVDDESASFTVIGAIGLQGIRLLNPTIGETIVVTGLGLVGLMSVQILRANGCRVIGIDYDTQKCHLAHQFGAQTIDLSKHEDPISFANIYSRGRGVDGVLITASSNSDEVIHQSAEMCRKNGRIVLVGVVGMNFNRDDFFAKELTFQVSASYGPGRYDPLYEERGFDYPIGYVRWTEQRNFEAILDMMSSGLLDVKPLISDRFDLENAIEAYEKLNSSNTLGILLSYSNQNISKLTSTDLVLLDEIPSNYSSETPRIGFIGAGNYASRVLIPFFRNSGAILDTLVTSSGVSAVHHGKKNKFLKASTETSDLWLNDKINTIVIATRHDLHADQVIDSLKAGSHVFVEKPLALTLEQLERVKDVYQNTSKTNKSKLMVGFNRRFAPHIIKIRKLLKSNIAPKTIIMTVNAGYIPENHWVQDKAVGGGRIIGECCHFIDLMRHLIGHKIIDYHVTKFSRTMGTEPIDDKATITLQFEDGSFGTVHYLANGHSSFPKERIEIFCGNAILQLDNYRTLKGFGWQGFKKMKLVRQDKGQKKCVNAFLESISQGQASPIPFNEIFESSRISIEIANLLRS